MLPVALIFCSVIAIFLGRYCYENLLTQRLYQCDWEHLLTKIEQVSVVTVSALGDEYLNPTPEQLGPEPFDLWVGMGGLEGVRKMRRNARVLIALADYAARWNFTEGVIVRERMRQDALHLERATFQIMVRAFLHMDTTRSVFYLHDSIAAYHLMTKRLLALYQTSHAGLYPRLAAVLGTGAPIRAAESV